MGSLDEDTIVAPATAPGRGGIGIVRISGKAAFVIGEKITGKKPSPRYAVVTPFMDAQECAVDEGLAIFFKGPHSFTGEDVVELQSHGNPLIMDLLVACAIHHGARLARPGEFSERAFLNDRLDLVQAEAVADLVSAGHASALRSAFASLQGVFSSEINSFLEDLIGLRVFIEACLDFPEEEIDLLDKEKILLQQEALLKQLDNIFEEAQRGSAITEGITLVIAGKPNAGKSSLLNALARRESAIVTEIPGTTRDVIREHIYLGGVPLHIIDTAGLRNSSDPVEQEGIRRAAKEIERADHVLLVTDSSDTLAENIRLEDLWPDTISPVPLNLPTTLVLNKCDLSGLAPAIDGQKITLSARTGAGMALLERHIQTLVGFQEGSSGRFSARRRHLSSLQEARAHLMNIPSLLVLNGQAELVAEELRLAQQSLEAITGRFTPEDLLDRVFRDFCIGK